jgi:hypothetical protein
MGTPYNMLSTSLFLNQSPQVSNTQSTKSISHSNLASRIQSQTQDYFQRFSGSKEAQENLPTWHKEQNSSFTNVLNWAHTKPAVVRFGSPVTIFHRGEELKIEPGLYVNGKEVGTMTLMASHLGNNKLKPYGNRPYLFIANIEVFDRYKNHGYSQLLVQQAVQESQRQGFDGRVMLSASNDRSPAGFLHNKNGFEYSDPEQQAALECFLKKYPNPSAENLSEIRNLTGSMYLPPEKIIKYLRKPSLYSTPSPYNVEKSIQNLSTGV